MKIGGDDRLQALIHSKKYAEDFKKYLNDKRVDQNDGVSGDKPWDFNVRYSDAGRKLCEKWGIIHTIWPRPELLNFKVPKMDENENIAYNVNFVFRPVSHLDPPEKWREFEVASAGQPEDNLINSINGKLVLMIDTSYPRDQIDKELSSWLDHYTSKSKERVRELLDSEDLDIWEIYRMKEFENMKFTNITDQIYYPADTPDYKKTSWDAYYKIIRRAYKKAEKIIKSIEEN